MEKADIRNNLLHLLELQEKASQSSKEYERLLLDSYKRIIGNFRTVFLFGGGTDGAMAYDFLSDIIRDKEVYFIDNDIEKHGKKLYKGIYCYGPEKMYGCDQENTIVLITTTKYAYDVQKEFLGDRPYSKPTQYQTEDKLGMTYIDGEFIWRLYTYLGRACYWLDREKLLHVFDWLDDDKSAQLFYRIILNRLSGNRWIRDMMTGAQYFPEEIKSRFTGDEVFLDCGAACGDSIEAFRNQTADCYKAIYSFEMDDENYKSLLNNPQAQGSRINCIHAGVSDCNRRIAYRKDQDICPSYVLEGTFNRDKEIILGEVELKSIDSMVADGTIREKVTFVKMDIEGAEMDALRGMEKLMKRDRPKLAICIYHKLEDIWELPTYIKSIVPEYTFIIRHHSHLHAETVLYAYIE